MNPIRVTWSRTVGMIRSQLSSVLALVAFLAGTGALFIIRLNAAEGGRLLFPSIWASAVSPILPALAALLGMEVWSGERQSGRIDLLLTTPVRERDFALGKFLGVWTWLGLSLLTSLALTMLALKLFAPSVLSGLGLVDLLPAVLTLLVQGALWAALALAIGVFFARPAAAALVAVLALVAVPRAVWAALMNWSARGRLAFGEFPLDAHAVDWASGTVSLSTVGGYLAVAVLALLVTVKHVTALRFVGRGALKLKWSTFFTMVLAVVLAVLTVMLARRHELAVELSVGGEEAFSSRTRQILAESSGDIVVTCYLSRRHPRFRDVSHLLRAFRQAAASSGGARFELQYVDPRWDLGAAERLSRRGVATDSLIFERGRRQVVLPLADGVGERLCATAIQRLSSPSLGRAVYWTTGHGEAGFDSYDNFGMSDIARELARSGYRNVGLNLAEAATIPSDCALIVIAGAKDDFSRVEVGRIDAYLRTGGRLLVLLGSDQAGGVVSLLPAWGLSTSTLPRVDVRTFSGSDVIASDFGDHVISAPLRGSQLVLESPVAFRPSAAAEAGAGADRLTFSPLAKVRECPVAAAVERGAHVGSDLALRPTRIVAVGDATFAMNGPLGARANANLDFFLNCVAYLSGLDAAGGDSTESARLCSGLDRDRQLSFAVVQVGVSPALVLLLLVSGIVYRRRRS